MMQIEVGKIFTLTIQDNTATGNLMKDNLHNVGAHLIYLQADLSRKGKG